MYIFVLMASDIWYYIEKLWVMVTKVCLNWCTFSTSYTLTLSDSRQFNSKHEQTAIFVERYIKQSSFLFWEL